MPAGSVTRWNYSNNFKDYILLFSLKSCKSKVSVPNLFCFVMIF